MSPKDAPRGRIVLVGNPNVGKSVIFGYLTGRYAVVSNYPGTTVEIARGNAKIGGVTYEVVDTPGTNSLIPQSEDERVTRDILVSESPDIIVQVADAKNLRRTLLLTTQLAEFGVPMVLVMNLMDEARARGISIDCSGIAELFGIPVVETVATYGEGLLQLTRAIQKATPPRTAWRQETRGDDPVLDDVDRSLQHVQPELPSLPTSLALEWLHGRDAALVSQVEGWLGPRATAALREVQDRYSRDRRRSIARDIERQRNEFLDEARERFKHVEPVANTDRTSAALEFVLRLQLALGVLILAETQIAPLAGWASLYTLTQDAIQSVAPAVSDYLGGWTAFVATLLVGVKNEDGVFEFGLLQAGAHFFTVIAPVVVPFFLLIRKSRDFSERFGRAARHPVWGAPTLLIVLLLMYEFVGYIGAQTLVGTLESGIFGEHLVPWLRELIPFGFVHDLLVGNPENGYARDYGLISVGVTYAVAIVLPVVGTFFIGFGLLEDSGYLPRLAILGDRIFRIMGLNGKAILPMVLGLGCDTMATMTTRILASKKERLIATLLLALGVPCSAQLGVILAISAGISPFATLVVLAVVLSQMLLVGYLSARIIKGTPSPFVFEIPPIRVPVHLNVAIKTGYRIKWFLTEAVPLFLLGTLILFLLDRIRLPFIGVSGIEAVEMAFKPVVTGLLYMPAETARVFILGFLRRDYGAAGLFDMARDETLSVQQLVVAMIVMTLFVPCIANFFVMIREHGTRTALAILAFVTPFAITVGAVVGLLLRTFHFFE